MAFAFNPFTGCLDITGMTSGQQGAFLKLDQTTPQSISGGKPNFLAGLDAGSTDQLGIDASGNLTTTGTGTFGQLNLIDTNTYLAVDGSTNLTFTDAITGTKTLAELATSVWVGTATSDLDMGGVYTIKRATDGIYSTLIGYGAASTYSYFVGIGYQATNGSASGDYGIAIGTQTVAGENSVAIGRGASADAPTSFAFGGYAIASAYNSLAIGYGAQATAVSASTIGAFTFSFTNSVANSMVLGGSTAGAVDEAWLRLGTGGIYDLAATPVLSIDPNNRQLYGSDGTTVRIDWSGTYNYNYPISFQGNDLILSASDGTVTFTIGANGNEIQVWKTMHLDSADIAFDSSSVITDGGYTSINPYSRTLNDSSGSTNFDWSTAGYLKDGSSATIFDYSSGQLRIGYGRNLLLDPSSSPHGNYIQTQGGDILIDASGYLVMPSGSLIVDALSGGYTSIDPYNRILYASDGTTPALNWSTGGRVLINGATDDTTSALQVNGNAKISGTITIGNPIIDLGYAPMAFANPAGGVIYLQPDGTDAVYEQSGFRFYNLDTSAWAFISRGTLLGNTDDFELVYRDSTGNWHQTWNFKAFESGNTPMLSLSVPVMISDRSGNLPTDDTTSALQVNGDVNISGGNFTTTGVINGLIHVGGDITGYETYGLTIQSSTGGMLLKRTSTSEPFVYVYNTTAGSGGQMRGLDAGGLRWTTGSASTEWGRINSTGLSIGASATGVKLTGANGVLTLAGLKSAGNNENLVIDFETTANTVGISSGTGVTSIKNTSIAQVVNFNDIKTTITDGLVLSNDTASDAVNTRQYPPVLRFRSHGWKTTGTADDYYDFTMYGFTDTGAATVGYFNWNYAKNGGGYTSLGGWYTSGPTFISGGGFQANSGGLVGIKLDIRTTSTININNRNYTAATSGTPVQYSPAYGFQGTGWDTTPTASSKTINWKNEMRPVSGSPTTSSLWWSVDQGVASYTDVMSLSNSGNLTIGSGAAGVDNTLTFNGETNDGVLTWMEDEDYFQFGDDIMLNDSELLKLGTGVDMSVGYNGTVGRIDTSLVAPSDLQIDCGTDKTLVLDEGVYNDANVGGLILRTGGTAPGVVQWLDNDGDATGLYTIGFADGEQGSGSIEVPHNYKEGTDLVFHIHFGINDAPTGTDQIRFDLIYNVQRDGTTFVDATTIDSTDVAVDTQYKTGRIDFTAITGTTFKIGDQFNFTIKRTTAAGDAFAGEVLIQTVGFHYEADTLGSRQIGTK